MVLFFLQVLHALHGKKTGKKRFTMEDMKNMEGETKQLNGIVFPSISSCASW